MKKAKRTYLIILGLVIAFLLLYTNGLSNVPTPKFSYSMKSASQTVSNQFTSQVGASLVRVIR